jgi:hypothetical protein
MERVVKRLLTFSIVNEEILDVKVPEIINLDFPHLWRW